MSKKNEISKYILGTLAVVGILAVAIVAPNLFAAFGRAGYRSGNNKRKFTNKQLYGSLYNLKRNGLVSIKQEGGKTVIILTKNGKTKALKFKLDDLTIKRPKYWDRKWRIVIFDIPENHKIARNAFTIKLKELGFMQLQRSVWIFPYECEDEIDFIKELYEIRPYVRIVTAEKLDLQNDLLAKFKL